MSDHDERDRTKRWSKNGTLLVGIIGFVGTLIGIWQFVIAPINERSDRRTLFDAEYESQTREDVSQMRSSTNMILSVIPNSIRDTRNNSLWQDIDREWSEHIGFLERFYRTFARGIRSETMQAKGAEHGETVCTNIEAVLKSHYQTVQRVGGIEGISTAYDEARSDILGVFTPVVRIPDPANMVQIFVHELGCEGDIEAIVNPPDTRSARQVLEEQIVGLETDLVQAERQTNIDQDAALEAQLSAFYDQYFGALRRMGVPQGEADLEARKALREIYQSGGYGHNFMVGGLNDYVERIRTAMENRNTDFEAVVASLQESLEEKRRELAALPQE